MRIFLTILEGPTPVEAEPILATEDPRLIRLVGSWLDERLSVEQGLGHELDKSDSPHATPLHVMQGGGE